MNRVSTKCTWYVSVFEVCVACLTPNDCSFQIFRDEFSVPSETYTNDPNRYINQAWGLPAGELTEEGKRLMLKLGRNIRRQKYPHFPKSDTFNPGDIYVRSIDTNRNILSAQMLLGGFYDTELDLKKAVPVHSSPSTQGNHQQKYETFQ